MSAIRTAASLDDRESTSHPFDAAAARYDERFSNRRLARWLRERVWAQLGALLPPGGHLLDLGCGTGEDALWWARRGHRVTAMDASAAMLEVARRKLDTAGLADRVTFLRRDLGDPGDIARLEAGAARYPLALLDFGVLNAIEHRQPLARVLGRLLAPGGRVVAVTMGPVCAWESFAFLASGRPRTAFRRLRGGAPADVRGGAPLPVWYPSPRRLRREWAPHLRHLGTEALGVLLPPSEHAGLVERWPRLFALARRADTGLARVPGMAWVADHYLSVFARD